MTDQQSQPDPTQEQSNKSLDEAKDSAKQFIKGISKQLGNTLIQWLPLGGTGTGFIFALIHQEWFIALILFPANMVTVIWASYTESFLERLQEVFQEEGRKDVDKLMTCRQRINKAVKETIRWQLAGTEDKYLKCQGNECTQYQTEGFQSVFTPLLSDVFVSLELSRHFLPDSDNQLLPLWPGFSSPGRTGQQTGRDLTIWHILGKAGKNTIPRSISIQAYGGYGKTTLLRHITYIYTRKLERKRAYNAPKLLPVLLYLRKWQELMGKPDAPLLPTLIERHHIPNLTEGKALKLPPFWAVNHLRQGKMLIMLDGFDEVKETLRDSVSQWIGQQLEDYPETFFILTSRPAGYGQYCSENKPATPLFIKPFNQEQQERFIQRWYLSLERRYNSQPHHPIVEIEANRKAASLNQQLQPIEGGKEGEKNPLRDFARNPLLLNTIVNLHASYPYEQLPQRRADLYKAIVRLQLGDRPMARQIDMPLEVNESQQVLQNLALFMTQANITKIEPEELERKLESYLPTVDESVSGSIFLNKIEQVSELLVQVDEAYEFAHKSFQEYLAACEIKRTQQEALLFENWQEQWWEAIIILYVAQLKNPNLFLRRLADIPDSQATKLAYKCLQETCRKVDEDLQELINKVQDKRYQQLEQYLKNGQWKEADRETYRLMLETVNKEAGELLEPEDIENFPCEDLHVLDGLWVSYSKGKFGFSVQKKIYFELGGTKEYKREVWIKFGGRVGWYNLKTDRWLEDMRYELLNTTRVGHLPNGGLASISNGFDLFSFLAHRLVDCSISPSQPFVNT